MLPWSFAVLKQDKQKDFVIPYITNTRVLKPGEKILPTKEMVAPKTKLINAEVVPEKQDDDDNEVSTAASNAEKHVGSLLVAKNLRKREGRPWCLRPGSSSMDRTCCFWYKRGAACASDVRSERQSQTAIPSRQLCAVPKCASHMSLCRHQRSLLPVAPVSQAPLPGRSPWRDAT